MTGPEVTAAMKDEDVDAGLVEKASNALSMLRHGIPGEYSDHTRTEMRRALAVALPLDRLAQLEEMRTEVQSWRPYDARDIGDAFLADSVVDLIQDRIDSLTATTEGQAT